MRFNDTNKHQIHPGNSGGIVYVRAANVTTSAATVRIFNTPDIDKTTITIVGADEDNTVLYDRSVPANDARLFPCDARYPIIVRNGTANAINWSIIQ